MKDIRQITNNVLQYVFIEDKDTPYMDNNITVLINGENAMLIDAAYSRQAAVVKKDLMSRGITVDEIILSHYHPDHAAGATEIPESILSCSSHYESNFYNCKDLWDKGHDYRRPEKIILDNTSKTYGGLLLSFYEAPGHTKCGIVTLIDEKIAHVGDLIMTDISDKPSVPSISSGGDFAEHLETLKLLRSMDIEVLILSHGKHLKGKEIVNRALDLRIHYLESVLKSNGEADIEEILIGGRNKWSFTKIHINNLTKLNNN